MLLPPHEGIQSPIRYGPPGWDTEGVRSDVVTMCPQALSAPDGDQSGKPEAPGVQARTLTLNFDKPVHASPRPMESPTTSYAQSEARLFAHVFTHAAELGGHELASVIAKPTVQQVLARMCACTFFETENIEAAALRYLAHVYNATLGMDFQVLEMPRGVYFFSDGALRRVLEDLQESGKFKDEEQARSWTKLNLERFLADVHTSRPLLEAFLLRSAPQSPAHAVAGEAHSRLQPHFLRDIVIPTANRPKEVARILSSIAKNFSFYGYNLDTLNICIFDTSSNSELRSATRKAAEHAAAAGLNIAYAGPSIVRARLLEVAAHLQGEPRAAFESIFLRGLFSEDRADGMPLTIGTIRNAISLLMADKPYISLDDDMMLDAVVPTLTRHQELLTGLPQFAAELDLHVGAANDFVRFATLRRDEFANLPNSIPTDFVGITCRNLDAPIYIAESRLVGDAGFSAFRKPKGRVSVVRPYLSNASPDVTVFLRAFLKTGDPGELSGEKAPAYLPLHAPSSCLFRGYSSGTMFATSTSIKVPFLDARAYEDVAQSQLTEFFNPHDVQFQGGTIEHRRSRGSRVLNSIQYVDALMGFHVMSHYISNVFPDSFVPAELMRETDQGKALRKLGRRMYRDAAEHKLSAHDLSEFSRAYQQMGARLREARIEGAATFSKDPVEVQREILSRHEVFLRTNGQLYYYWNRFAAAARQVSRTSEL